MKDKKGRNIYLDLEGSVVEKLLTILPTDFVELYNSSSDIRVVTLGYLRYLLLYLILLVSSFHPLSPHIGLLANTSGMLIGTIITIISFLLFVKTRNPAIGTNLVLVSSMLILFWLSYSYGGMANNILRHDALIFAMGMFFGTKGVFSAVGYNILSTTIFLYWEKSGADFYYGRSTEEIREIMWYHAMYQTGVSTFLMYSYERKQAQVLRYMTEANHHKTEFLCRMSHELRTPLVGIVGAIDILNNAKNITQDQLKLIEIAKSCATNLLGIINDVLDYSKLEAEKMKLHFENVNLRDVIESCTQVVSPLITSKPKLRLKVNFNEKKLPQSFLGDSLRIRQVLINLLSNAVKFTEQGKITVKVSLEQNINAIPWLLHSKSNEIHTENTSPVQHRRAGSVDKSSRMESTKTNFSAEKQPSFLVFSVADTGIGIEAQTIPKVFESFEQADSSTSKKYGGSGLGLAICKNICKLHGGDIAAESAGKGKGSTFYFYIPYIEVTEHSFRSATGDPKPVRYPSIPPVIDIDETQRVLESTSGTSDPDPSDKNSILLAEDNKVNQLIIKTMISKLNYHVDIANNGAEAIEKMKLKKYSLVFMDIEMPELNGLEATRQLRCLGYTTPIIALTAHALVETREEAFRHGVNEVIPKPCNFEQLRTACTTFISKDNKNR